MTIAETGGQSGGLVVRIAGERRLIPVAHVVEVLREATIIRVPGADRAVAGMVNHRGRVVTVADAARALGLGSGDDFRGEIVVVSWEQKRFGLGVGSVVELIAEARTGLAEIDLARIAAATFA
ncbi:MAG: chemotaxis protein CheW [Gemmatimonadales bacterium]